MSSNESFPNVLLIFFTVLVKWKNLLFSAQLIDGFLNGAAWRAGNKSVEVRRSTPVTLESPPWFSTVRNHCFN